MSCALSVAANRSAIDPAAFIWASDGIATALPTSADPEINNLRFIAFSAVAGAASVSGLPQKLRGREQRAKRNAGGPERLVGALQPIHQGEYQRHLAARVPYGLDRLNGGATRRGDVFHDDHTL